MSFSIKRSDAESFRNFSVKIGDSFLIDRNDDFYSELSEWVDGILVLMGRGKSYFSSTSGFIPFFAEIAADDVEFEKIDGAVVSTNFGELVRGTIIFLFEQARDESFSERDGEFFEKKGNLLLSGYRFRYKTQYRDFVSYLNGKKLLVEDGRV